MCYEERLFSRWAMKKAQKVETKELKADTAEIEADAKSAQA